MSAKQSQSPSRAELEQFTRLYREGQLDRAAEFGRKLASGYPGDASLDNMLGVVYAGLGDLESARRRYESALNKKPDYAEANNNLGNLLSRMGRTAEAVGHFREAIRIYPDYFVAHNNLGSALHDLGDETEAIRSYDVALKLRPDYAEAYNNKGNSLADLGNMAEALDCFSRAIHHDPRLVQAYANLGNCLRSLGRLDEAIECCKAAIRIAPTYARAYQALGNAQNEQGLHADAVANLRKSIELDSGNAAAHVDLGNALSDSGLHEDAMRSYQAALTIRPDYPEVHCNLGNALCETGDYDRATESYEEALRLNPMLAEAYNNLSKIKKFSADDAHLETMLKQHADPRTSDNDRMHLGYAIGKAFGDIGRYDDAFEYLSEANRLRKTELGYDIRRDRAQFEAIKSLFGPGAELPQLQPLDDEPAKPIFIVGMPRSGTTLTEQILASHPLVSGAGELHTAGRVLVPAVNAIAAGQGRGLDKELLANLRETYLSEIGGYADSTPYVTDKMPANFRWVGFLLQAMPGVKIINLQRDPVAICWSMFKLMFAGNGYTNDLRDLGEYYLLYTDLMGFWRERFPDQVYDLDYESLTENQEPETRQLLEYCGLPWDPACLEFHKTKRTVRTPSSQQVRQKMYTGSSEAWRNYERHLGPLLEVLERQ